MAGFEAYLFDVDGTLADTERDGHRLAFNKAFAEAGLEWEWSVPVYGELLAVTGGKERMRHYLEHYDPPFAGVTSDLGDYFATLHAAKTRHYAELVSAGAVALRPGIERLLNEARANKIRLAIATTTTLENVTALLASTLGEVAIDWFELIAAGDIVPRKKPAPDIYQYALDRMRLAAEECLAFEDSANGIAAAKGAGLTTVITINDYTHDHDFSDAELVVSDLGETGQPMRVIGGSKAASFAADRWLDVAALNKLR